MTGTHDVVRTTDRSKRLAEAGERLFAERGYAAVAIRDVAAAADVPAGAVFYHYPKKAALALAVAQRHGERIQDALDGNLTRDDGARRPLDRLVDLLSSDEARMAEHGFGIARLSMDLAAEGEDATEAKTACLQILVAIEEGVRRCLLAEGLDARDAASAATRFLMVWHGALIMAKAYGVQWLKHNALPEVLSVLRDAVGVAERADISLGATRQKVSRPSRARGRTPGPTEVMPHLLPDADVTDPPPLHRTPDQEERGTGASIPWGTATPADVLQALGTILDEAGKPLQRRHLLDHVARLLLAERSLGMPGRNPFENLLTIVSKDKARTFINLTPHGIWIRARSYHPLGYVAGAEWKRSGQAESA
ncbi:TetR/AcrR family transcriptional regulator [Methylobacterium sp. R2-1]|uniref:TetR/AcrR family transcriptional regulator n=1 Tax=Methylobacterium sp. R2-1 TaxID=2587064 RepID=UPI00160908A2|nr:TetR family transcriptional regulator [Methylobacterium sp. R2-1]MBB2961912.1 AcrR family transcriptional regulator [Methylobacterium sp. R2-1]